MTNILKTGIQNMIAKLKPINDEITKLVQELWNLSQNFQRGTIVPWLQIESITGDRTDPRSHYIINKWRRRLEREREIVTLVADGVGVRLLTQRETASEIPAIRQKKAYRQIRRAIKQTALVNVAELSDHERRLLASQRQNMAETRRELFRSQKETRTATQTNPLRKS